GVRVHGLREGSQDDEQRGSEQGAADPACLIHGWFTCGKPATSRPCRDQQPVPRPLISSETITASAQQVSRQRISSMTPRGASCRCRARREGRGGPGRTTGLRDRVPVLVEASPCPHACVCSSRLAFSSPQSELPPPQAFSPIPPRPPSPSPSSRGM